MSRRGRYRKFNVNFVPDPWHSDNENEDLTVQNIEDFHPDEGGALNNDADEEEPQHGDDQDEWFDAEETDEGDPDINPEDLEEEETDRYACVYREIL